jgi:hypothetical protein
MAIYSDDNKTHMYLWWTDYTTIADVKAQDIPTSGGADITVSLTYFT